MKMVQKMKLLTRKQNLKYSNYLIKFNEVDKDVGVDGAVAHIDMGLADMEDAGVEEDMDSGAADILADIRADIPEGKFIHLHFNYDIP